MDPAEHSLTTGVVSFYMNNVSADVVSAQRSVLERFNPLGFALKQVLTVERHGAAIDAFLAHCGLDLILLLDIDCVPLTMRALPAMATRAASGALVGCVQRANHIQNNAHLYAGPFCMAFTRRLWEDLDRPSFLETPRGDVGEEFTYRCEASGGAVDLLWPSHVPAVHWALADGHGFGPHTEYEGLFLHAFGIRDAANQECFVQRCRKIVGVDG